MFVSLWPSSLGDRQSGQRVPVSAVKENSFYLFGLSFSLKFYTFFMYLYHKFVSHLACQLILLIWVFSWPGKSNDIVINRGQAQHNSIH